MEFLTVLTLNGHKEQSVSGCVDASLQNQTWPFDSYTYSVEHVAFQDLTRAMLLEDLNTPFRSNVFSRG